MARTKQWTMRLQLSEEGGRTEAHAVLETGITTLRGAASARCNPHDADVPEIGDELAAGRALAELARQLIRTAQHDISAAEGRSAAAS